MKKLIAPLLGLLLILAYWYSIHPPGFERVGYAEDPGSYEIMNRIVDKQLTKSFWMSFKTDLYMNPSGAALPYFPWSLERDLLGGLFRKLNTGISWIWLFFGASLLISYFGSSYFLKKMKLPSNWAWALATIVVLFNYPRNFKVWYHAEHLPMHWLYIGFFFDAWIWQRFEREKKISIHLELWRLFTMQLTLNLAGYYWGFATLLWIIVRGCMWYRVKKKKDRFTWEYDRKKIFRPFLAMFLLGLVQLYWFVPLVQAAIGYGSFKRGTGWGAMPWDVFEPLWLHRLWDFAPVMRTETMTNVGWFLWIPVIFAIWTLRKKKDVGLKPLLPFLVILAIAIMFILKFPLPLLQLIRVVVPFMGFFRVFVRIALVLPIILVCIFALAWPWLKARYPEIRRKHSAWLVVFGITSLLDMSYIFEPPLVMPPPSDQALNLLQKAKASPGSILLDMPFCVAGGNRSCHRQCVHYPYSTVGQSLPLWHDKRVFGVYVSRASDQLCDIYQKPPYTSWFNAWGDGRCLTESEWKDTCKLIRENGEIGSVLIYPDLWRAAGTPQCENLIKKWLGPIVSEAILPTFVNRTGQMENPTRVWLVQKPCRN
ncbi:hypothetical protein K2X30_07255 [bacterium]|nr:hypothetical protein [bacterium]